MCSIIGIERKGRPIDNRLAGLEKKETRRNAPGFFV